MKYLGEDVCEARGLKPERAYNYGCWVAWNTNNNDYVFTITAVFGDETECLRWAVANNQSVAFLPYGQEAEPYITKPPTTGLEPI